MYFIFNDLIQRSAIRLNKYLFPNNIHGLNGWQKYAVQWHNTLQTVPEEQNKNLHGNILETHAPETLVDHSLDNYCVKYKRTAK